MPVTFPTETAREGLFTSTRWTTVLDAGESQTSPDEALRVLLELVAPHAACSIGLKLSLQRDTKFRGGKGKSSESRVTQDKDHKPKTRKENQIMKNRSIQFNAIAL